jgi:hypothetical protein
MASLTGSDDGGDGEDPTSHAETSNGNANANGDDVLFGNSNSDDDFLGDVPLDNDNDNVAAAPVNNNISNNDVAANSTEGGTTIIAGDDAAPVQSSKRKRDEDKQNKVYFSITNRDDDFVQWDALADTKWGTNPLIRYVSVPEVEELVGWATHVQRPVPAADVNPLLNLPSTPLPPSLLIDLENTVSQLLAAEELSDQWESFDQSALVAIGIALEEMITTNLLPLAQLHVQRCRQLEVTDGSEERLFSEWTLPPEEAVDKLVEKAKSQPEPEVCLATAYPSTRTRIPHAPGTSLLNQPTAKGRNKKALMVWCQASGLDPAFVKSNKEMLGIFLPH